jgi:hypothetical protein
VHGVRIYLMRMCVHAVNACVLACTRAHARAHTWHVCARDSCAVAHACMYVCMHACMYVYMYACMYVCMCVCVFLYNSSMIQSELRHQSEVGQRLPDRRRSPERVIHRSTSASNLSNGHRNSVNGQHAPPTKSGASGSPTYSQTSLL